MSIKSRSLAGALQERGLVAKAEMSSFAGKPASAYLRRTGNGDLIEVMRLLVRAGVSTRRAKEIADSLNRRGEAVAIMRHAPADFARRFADHGITATSPKIRNVNVKQLRQRLGLSQSEFAARFAIEDSAIKNWEQRRAEPVGAAQVLLNLIDRDPDAVTAILAAK